MAMMSPCKKFGPSCVQVSLNALHKEDALHGVAQESGAGGGTIGRKISLVLFSRTVEVKQRVTLHFRRQPATLGGVGFVARQKPVKSIWAVRLDNRQPKRKKCGKKKKKEKEDLVANR